MKLSNVLTIGFWKRFLLWSSIGLLLFALFGFFALPYILKAVLTSQLTQRLHREATIQEVHFNPFYLTLQVKNFTLKDRNGTDQFVSFEELALNLEVASIWRRGPIVREVTLKTPQVSIVRNEDLSYNFSDLLTPPAAAPQAQPEPAPAASLHFSINNIRLENGSLDFDDRPKHAQHRVRDLNIGIPFLSNLPYDIDVYTQPSFSVNVNGTPIELTGRSKPFSDARETALDVQISHIELAKYLEYVPADLHFKINSGSLGAKLAISFIQSKDQSPALVVTGKIGLDQLAVVDLEEHPLITLPLLDVPIESLDVFARKAHFGAILLQGPEVHLQLDKAGVLNLTTLVGNPKPQTPAGEQTAQTTETKEIIKTDQKPEEKTEQKTATAEAIAPEKAAKTEGTPIVVEVPEIRLVDGKVAFIDDTHEQTFQTMLESLNVVVHNVSTDAAKPISLEVSCKSDAGEIFQHTATVVREPLKAEGSVLLQQILVNRYAPYYAKQLLFGVEEGTVDVATQFAYVQEPEHSPSTVLSGLTLKLKTLRLRKYGEKEDFLKIPAFAVNETTIDVGKQTVTVGEVATSKGALQIRRERDGTLSLAALTPASPPAAAAPPPKPTTPSPKKKKSPPEPTPPATDAAAAPSWLVQVKKITLDQYAARFDDLALRQPASVIADPLSVSVENFSTQPNAKMNTAVQVTLNKRGAITVAGPLSLSPLAATLKVTGKDIDILPFRPYFADKVKIVLTSGSLSTEGNLALQPQKDKSLNVTYAGQMAVAKFATIDKATTEDFLKWRSLSVTGVNVSTNPMRVDIGEVALADFYSRLTIHPDATLNVQGIVVDQPPSGKTTEPPQATNTSAQPPAATGGPTPIKIAKVTFQRGTVDFSDHYIKPNYSAKLTQLGGRVAGLVSGTDSPADVDLQGSWDNVAPLQITGKINPFSKDLFVDLSVDFKDVDLNPMTPYSGKYAGYTIEKGKLTLNLRYLIANRQLKAENKVFIDQFTFGDSVNSAEATSLPVKLAIALLKDRNGVIALDLPMSGSLDDPQFSIWGTVMQVVTNLIAKAATAPFALLGAVFGGGSGEDMNQVEFAYGRATIDEPAQGKLKKIGEVLADRTSLSLEIAGYAERDKDLDGLRHYRFERKLKAQKLAEQNKKETEDASLDTITIAPEEYLQYLTMAYKEETFPKPRNMLGLAKGLPQEEMETLMFTHIEVTDEDLQELARQRAAAVRDYLVKTGGLESGRLFLIEPKSVFSTQTGDGTGSRAELVIK